MIFFYFWASYSLSWYLYVEYMLCYTSNLDLICQLKMDSLSVIAMYTLKKKIIVTNLNFVVSSIYWCFLHIYLTILMLVINMHIFSPSIHINCIYCRLMYNLYTLMNIIIHIHSCILWKSILQNIYIMCKLSIMSTLVACVSWILAWSLIYSVICSTFRIVHSS